MTLASGDLADTVRRMLAEEVGLSEHDLDWDVPLDRLGIDSLDVLYVASRFERDFDILVDTRDVESVRTLRDVVDRLRTKLAP